jgi:5-(carboxyamino)imidazole ribonucleotide mutase
MSKAAIVMGSKSDLEVCRKAAEIFAQFGVSYEVRVISAHRTPQIACDFASKAEENGFDVIIAAAGKAAHLAGVIAAHTVLPVIGLPVKSSTMDGLDSLLSTVQMPAGVPVACVAINGAENAALLALQIMAAKSPQLREKLKKYKNELAEKTIADDKQIGGLI